MIFLGVFALMVLLNLFALPEWLRCALLFTLTLATGLLLS